MFALIKCILGVILIIGGTGVQQKSRNREICDFILGTEFALAGLIIIATA